MTDPETPHTHANPEDATAEDMRDPLPRLLIAPIAVVVILVLVGLPVLRVLSQDNDNEATRRQAANEARQQVAQFFTSAVLEDRSVRIAERYVLANLRPAVAEIVADLRRRDSAELEGAVATLEHVVCRAPVPDGECFRAELGRPGEPTVTALVFTVAIVDGSARVTAIGDILTALRR